MIRFIIRKIPPIFSPSSWNVHNAILVGEHWTNNMTEGWNNRFSKLCGHKHPTIWKLIRKIKMEISADEAKLALDAVGDSKTVKKLGQTRRVEKRLQNICIQIQVGNIGFIFSNLNKYFRFFNSRKSLYKKELYLIIIIHFYIIVITTI